MFSNSLKFIFIIFILLAAPFLHAESGPGNGTDYVKVLFAEAQNNLRKMLQPLSLDQVREFGLDSDCQNWLSQTENSQSHWDSLKFYISQMRLSFQEAPCEDSQGRQSSICFYNDNPNDPYVLISLKENKSTSPEQAMAMLVHEAGHFVGEMNHLFLDRLGVQIVHGLLEPKSFSVTVSSTELVGNIFEAKQGCEEGTSSQARHLWQQAQVKLAELCQLHRKSCDFNRALLSYQGSIEQKPGVGFTMNVSCELKALLPLEKVLWLQSETR